MEDKTTLTDINEVMKIITSDHEALKNSWSVFERKFKDLFGYKPNQTVTAFDVVAIINRYQNGNGGIDDSDKN
jgi:hypothetical protein